MPEEAITEADVERMKRGFALYNAGDFDGLREFVSPDVVVERVGGLPPVHGWDAVRKFFEPDAFDSQNIQPLDWTVNGDKVLLHVRIRNKGAGSGLELNLDGWFVWTVADHVVVRLQSFVDEPEARAAAGLGQNASP